MTQTPPTTDRFTDMTPVFGVLTGRMTYLPTLSSRVTRRAHSDTGRHMRGSFGRQWLYMALWAAQALQAQQQLLTKRLTRGKERMMSETEVKESESGVGEAGAVFGFMAWLTTRYTESGPFSRYIDASQAAQLAGEFCKLQGWEVDDDRYPKNLVRFPNDVPDGADEAHLRGTGTEEDPYRTTRPTDDSATFAVAEYAVWGARNDPRIDKSDWIRMWAQARQALKLPYGPEDWKAAYGDR